MSPLSNALIERLDVPGHLIATPGDRMAASGTSRMKWLVDLWIAAAILLMAIGGAGAQPKSGDPAAQAKQVLFLYSLGPNFQPWAAWGKSIREEMNRQSPWPLNVQEYSLVSALAGNDVAGVEFVEYLMALYAERKPDLIVAIGAPAARFVQQHRADLFPTTPMLLAAVEVRRVEQSMLAEQDTFVGTRVDHTVLIDNILRLLPETKTISMIIGNSPPERLWIKDVQRELKPVIGDKVELRFYNAQSFGNILGELAELPPHSAIFFQQLMLDGAGAVYGDKEPLKRISDVANAPIFTFDESFFYPGVVGGPMSSPADGGRATAAVAVRMLEGEKATAIKVPTIEFAAPKYDWRQLRRWNISEDRLPPGSEVLFREPTAWQRYSWQIAFVAVALLLQAGLIAILLRERRQRHLAEVQSRQRMVELAHVNRFSTAGEMAGLIAHEINQPLGAILSNAETAEIILKSPSPDLPELREIVSDILRDDQRASEVIRRMRALLKKAPFELKSLDLSDLVRETVEFLSMLAHGRKVELRSQVTPDALPILGDRIQLQQAILNLVVNGIDAMKDMPSESRIISIETSRAEKFAELSVSDRGPGIPEDKLKEVFDPFYTTKAGGMGMGLSITRTIIEAHDGLILAKNGDHGGAVFRIRLPLVR
jgi:signal transduction histidine kinase